MMLDALRPSLSVYLLMSAPSSCTSISGFLFMSVCVPLNAAIHIYACLGPSYAVRPVVSSVPPNVSVSTPFCDSGFVYQSLSLSHLSASECDCTQVHANMLRARGWRHFATTL